ncbi:MAG TPA: type III toxin-antitoxin system ToxN/AbiQ family toxin [Lachnospiraceae bacterium]|nr:type III toxin-antitoxin system ToxN/AbiQ family toxin [Lachnospiraceae bacterium]
MNLSFYLVDSAYCDFLRKSDPRVPYTMEHKSTRPFVGIVFTINNVRYYAPLSSPKPKHLQMKNQLDFLKINHGTWGVINFNNMIPVPSSCLTKVDLQIVSTDSEQDIAYKNLLSNQLSWCNSHKNAILTQAQKLYRIITQGKPWDKLAERCCNFSLNEQQCLLYRP